MAVGRRPLSVGVEQPEARSRRWPVADGRRWSVGAVLIVLVAFAFGIRVYAVRWSLPFVDHPDEPNLVNYVLRTLQTGDLNPHVFRKPTLYFYLLLAVLSVHYRLGVQSGLYTDLAQMNVTTHLYTTIPGFFVWGRMLTVVIGTVTVLTVYVLGKQAWGRGAGLFAAIFIATSQFHMRHSQYITTDVACAWFATLTFIATVAVVKQPSWRNYLLAGFLSGLTAATKYNAGAIVFLLLAAHVIVWRWQAVPRLPRLLAAGTASLGGFVLAMPYAVLDWSNFARDILGEARGYYEGSRGDFHGAWDLGGYVDFIWNGGLGPIACVALLIGVIVLIRQRPSIGLLWLSFAVPYWLILLAQQVHFVRNLMPLIVLCALPIGVAGAAILARAQTHMARGPALAAAVVLVALYAYPAREAISFTRFEAMPNSKLLASNLVRTLPRGQRIAVELNPVEWAHDPIIESIESIIDRPLTWYRANNYRYLITNAADHDRRQTGLYDELEAQTKVVQVFPGDDGGQPGPRIAVLDLSPDPGTLQIVRQPAHFGDQLQLLGYEARPGDLRPAVTPLEGADQRVLPPGVPLQLNLTWQALGHLPHDYALFIHVLDTSGTMVAQRDALLRAEDYPTSRWQPGEIVIDRADLPLPALPPGTYQLVIGVYRMDTFERLPLVHPAPSADDSSLLLTTIDVTNGE